MLRTKKTLGAFLLLSTLSLGFFLGLKSDDSRVRDFLKPVIKPIVKWFVPNHESLQVESWFERKTKNKKVLVFVHGVTGTALETWKYEKNGKEAYWPKLLMDDENYDDYDIYVVSYDTSLQKKAPSIFQLAQILNNDLKKKNIYQDKEVASQYNDVIFICHSMGNLVVRAAMAIDPPDPRFLPRIPLILSLASPSKGSALADKMDILSDNPQFKAMRAVEEGNEFLQLLNEIWTSKGFDTEIACAYEEKNVRGLRIVSKDSATAVCTRPDLKGFVEEDHISIVKPSGKGHPVYDWVQKELRKPSTKGWEQARWRDNKIIIAGKLHQESNIHAAMLAVAIREMMPNLQVEVRYREGNANRVFAAFRNNEIDIFPEYDGSLLFEHLGMSLSNSQKKFSTVAINGKLRASPKTMNMVYFPHFGFHNPYILVMLRSKARELGLLEGDGIVTISELAKVSEKLIIEAEQGFFFRKDGFPGLENTYSIKFKNRKNTLHSHVYENLRKSRDDETGVVIVGYGTDNELNIGDTDLVEIQDDKNSFPLYRPAPLANKFLMRKYDDLAVVFDRFKGKLSRKAMSKLLGDTKKIFDQQGPLEDARKKELETFVLAYLKKIGVIKKKFDLSGHRGTRGLCPENTLPAFAKALSIGVTTLEMDVVVTKDRVPMIYHDATLDPNITRKPNGKWIKEKNIAINTLTKVQLQKYDVGQIKPGCKYAKKFPDQQAIDDSVIPKLSDVIELVRNSGNRRVKLSIEAKINVEKPELSPGPKEFAELLVQTLKKEGFISRVIIQSFDWRILQHIQLMEPEIPTAYLTYAQDDWHNTIELGQPGPSKWTGGIDVDDHGGSIPRAIKASGSNKGGKIWSPYYKEIGKEQIDEAHELGVSVVVYTINDPKVMAQYIDFGVDGIITDYPDRLRSVMKEKGMRLPKATQMSQKWQTCK